MTTDWADEKVAEWYSDPTKSSLAALLREARKDTLAEVRKIVEDEAAAWACNCDEAWKGRSLIDPDCGKCNYISEVCDEILRRIEGLDG